MFCCVGNWFIHVPITNPELATFEHRKDATEKDIEEAQQVDPWSWWNELRFAVKHNGKVKVVLELSDSDRPSRETVRRWLGEPIEAIIIPSSLFVLNRSNYYVLHKEWQAIVGHFISVRANIIVSTNANDNAISQYAEYVKKLINDHGDTHTLNKWVAFHVCFWILFIFYILIYIYLFKLWEHVGDTAAATVW